MLEETKLNSLHIPVRLFLISLSGMCLVGALWGGLVRLGWGDFSPLIGSLPGIHGPLVVCGFLGTFFSLERAVTLKGFAGYLAPILTAAGCIALVFHPLSRMGPMLVVAGSVIFFILCVIVLRRQFTLYALFMVLGSIQWTLGNVIWLMQWPVYNVTLWWMSFVLLTTAGERLEVARMAHIKTGPWIVLLVALGAVFFGHILVAVGHVSGPDSLMDIVGDAIFDPRIVLGMKVAGSGMVLSSLWFVIYDPARTFLGRPGLSGYVAFCMVSGYVWLAVSGVCSLAFAGLVSGEVYDIMVHVFFLGFLMSMIFGHGPILIPSILGLYADMRKVFYVSPVLLHVALAMRVTGGLTHLAWLRKLGGLLLTAAIGCFLVTLFYALWKDNRDESSEPA